MEPNRFGRKLGIGVRVASRMAKERAAKAASASQPAASAPQAAATQAAPQSNTTPRPSPPPPAPRKNFAEPARRVGQSSRRIGEGTRRFGKAVIGPLAHVSGTLWLEITGLFFALFAAFFGQNAWRIRASALHGPDHAHFLVATIAALIFAWFAIGSFVKAAHRGRAHHGRSTGNGRTTQ